MTSFSETFKGWFSHYADGTTEEIEIYAIGELRTRIRFTNTGLIPLEALAVVDRELGYELKDVAHNRDQRVIDAYNNEELIIVFDNGCWSIVNKSDDFYKSMVKMYAEHEEEYRGEIVDSFPEECTCDDSDCTCQPCDWDDASEEELAYFHDTYPAILVGEENSSPKELKYYANRDSLGNQIHVGDTVTVNNKYAIVTLVTPSVLYVRMTNEKSTDKYVKTSKDGFYCELSDRCATIVKALSLLKGLLEFEITNGCVVASIAYNHSWEKVLYAIWLYVNKYTPTEDGKDLPIDSTGMCVYTADTDRKLRECIGHPYSIPADDKASQALIDNIFTNITTLYNKTIKELKYEFRKKCFYIDETTKRKKQVESFKAFCRNQHITIKN